MTEIAARLIRRLAHENAWHVTADSADRFDVERDGVTMSFSFAAGGARLAQVTENGGGLNQAEALGILGTPPIRDLRAAAARRALTRQCGPAVIPTDRMVKAVLDQLDADTNAEAAGRHEFLTSGGTGCPQWTRWPGRMDARGDVHDVWSGHKSRANCLATRAHGPSWRPCRRPAGPGPHVLGGEVPGASIAVRTSCPDGQVTIRAKPSACKEGRLPCRERC